MIFPGSGHSRDSWKTTAVMVVVDEQTRRQLFRTARSARAQARAVVRAKIILAAADGTPNARIAADLHLGVDTVRKWRSRFAVCGLADAKRSGRARLAAHPRWHVHWTPVHAS